MHVVLLVPRLSMVPLPFACAIVAVVVVVACGVVGVAVSVGAMRRSVLLSDHACHTPYCFVMLAGASTAGAHFC